MAFFWHGHFTSEWGKVYDTGAMMQQNKLFRDDGLGNVRTLAQAMAIQPAMLRYLDNADNRKSSPNQNFGRELLELFLLGVGNYTEADVEAATLAWTGHGIELGHRPVRVPPRPTRHHRPRRSSATRSRRPGRHRRRARSDSGDRRRAQRRARRRGLWRPASSARSCGSRSPTRRPPATIVNASQRSRGQRLRHQAVGEGDAVLAEFHSATARQGLVKHADRVHRRRCCTTPAIAASVAHPQWYAEDMGQAMFYPPNVSGWRINGYWINASAVAARAEFAGNVRWRLQRPATVDPADAPRRLVDMGRSRSR